MMNRPYAELGLFARKNYLFLRFELVDESNQMLGRQALEFHNRALVCTQTEAAAAHRFAHTICGG